MADAPRPDPPRKRRRVFVTAGLSASAAVLAMSVQNTVTGDEDRVTSSYGDPVAAEPDADDQSRGL